MTMCSAGWSKAKILSPETSCIKEEKKKAPVGSGKGMALASVPYIFIYIIMAGEWAMGGVWSKSMVNDRHARRMRRYSIFSRQHHSGLNRGRQEEGGREGVLVTFDSTVEMDRGWAEQNRLPYFVTRHSRW